MAKAPFNLAHSAAAVTLARYFAKRAVKDDMRKAGLKPRYMTAKELSLAAGQYLHEHLDELIGQPKSPWQSGSFRTKYPFPACKQWPRHSVLVHYLGLAICRAPPRHMALAPDRFAKFWRT